MPINPGEMLVPSAYGREFSARNNHQTKMTQSSIFWQADFLSRKLFSIYELGLFRYFCLVFLP